VFFNQILMLGFFIYGCILAKQSIELTTCIGYRLFFAVIAVACVGIF